MLTSAAPVVANDNLSVVPNRPMSLVYSHDWLANTMGSSSIGPALASRRTAS
jgi:hypothetical protein